MPQLKNQRKNKLKSENFKATLSVNLTSSADLIRRGMFLTMEINGNTIKETKIKVYLEIHQLIIAHNHQE